MDLYVTCVEEFFFMEGDEQGTMGYFLARILEKEKARVLDFFNQTGILALIPKLTQNIRRKLGNVVGLWKINLGFT